MGEGEVGGGELEVGGGEGAEVAEGDVGAGVGGEGEAWCGGLWIEFGQVGGVAGALATVATVDGKGCGAEVGGECGGGSVVERKVVGFGGEEAGACSWGGAAGEDGIAGGVGCDGGECDGGAGEGGVGSGEAAEADGLVDGVLLGDAEGVAVADVREWCEWEEPGGSGEGADDPGVLVWRWCEGGLCAWGEKGGGEDGAAVEG